MRRPNHRHVRTLKSIWRPLCAVVCLALIVSCFLLPWFGKAMPDVASLSLLFGVIGGYVICRSVEKIKDKD